MQDAIQILSFLYEKVFEHLTADTLARSRHFLAYDMEMQDAKLDTHTIQSSLKLTSLHQTLVYNHFFAQQITPAEAVHNLHRLISHFEMANAISSKTNQEQEAENGLRFASPVVWLIKSILVEPVDWSAKPSQSKNNL
jgi:hypothetical protein